jgi:hypothetical protein
VSAMNVASSSRRLVYCGRTGRATGGAGVGKSAREDL